MEEMDEVAVLVEKVMPIKQSQRIAWMGGNRKRVTCAWCQRGVRSLALELKVVVSHHVDVRSEPWLFGRAAKLLTAELSLQTLFQIF